MKRTAYIPLRLERSLKTSIGQKAIFDPGVVGVLFAYETMERLREDCPEGEVITVSYDEPDEEAP